MLLMKTSPAGCIKNCGRRTHFSGIDCHVVKEDDDHVTDSVNLRELVDDTRLNGTSTTTAFRMLEQQLRSLHTLIDSVVRKEAEKERILKARKSVDDQWRFLALVLDRLFFVSYLVVIILSLTLLFPRSAILEAML